MKYFVALLIIVNITFSQSGENQSFKLKDGSVVVGTIQNETDTEIEVLTKFGLVVINKSSLIQTQYEIKLNSGETLIGTKAEENDQTITLITSMGTLTIQRSDILNIQEVGKQSSTESANSQGYYRRPYGITDFLFGGSKIDKDTEFALGEEQLTDLFFDPTGYTFTKSTLYLSGLSFGFGITDDFQITTKWSGFFYGNMNLRPKYKVFEIGNWENQHALSIGAHYHTRWIPNKYEWKSGSVNVIEFTGKHDNYGDSICPGNGGWCWKQTAPADTVEKFWGEYFRMGEESTYSDPTYNYPDGYDPNETEVYYDHEPWENYDNDYDEENYMEMIEFFGAYTYSKARGGLKGRISHTLGANIQHITLNDDPTILYRGYYGLDVDINSKLKMIGEIFYDPYYLELWQQMEYDDGYWDSDYNSDPVPNPNENGSVHLDFGFMYAVNESFRFGIHFQKPFVAFYWKL